MKKLIINIARIIFACIFIAGIIGILIPFDFENFTYSIYSTTESNSSGVEITNKSDEDYSNVTIFINYSIKSSRDSQTTEKIINGVNFKEKGSNYIELSSIGNFKNIKVNSIKLTFEEGKSFNIYSIPFFSGINWTFICFVFIGFFGGAICFGISKSNKREQEINEGDKKSFNDKIREAFTPVADTINTLRKTYEDSKKNINNTEEKNKKITCPYCKGKYSSSDDKCPHCGAPPEPYD